MKVLKYVSVCLTVFVIFKPDSLFSQFFYNNGAEISITSGAYVRTSGDFCNDNSGIFENQGIFEDDNGFVNNAEIFGNGKYFISGNWLNNGLYTCNYSDVHLNGGGQTIGGNHPTAFYNLELEGSGIKTLAVNADVKGVLKLNDKELATDNFILMIENPAGYAIVRTTGFVSSAGTGALARRTNSDSVYLFPVGSSQGFLRYRPVEIKPLNSLANIYAVRMINNDASYDGYNRFALDSGICTTNSLFYHMIDKLYGASPADISICFDSVYDGNWTGLANWQTIPTALWRIILPVYSNYNNSLKSLFFPGWNNFNNKYFILSKLLKNSSIIHTGAFCSDAGQVELSAAEEGGVWSGTGITDCIGGVFNPAVAGNGTHNITYTIDGTCGSSDTAEIIVNKSPEISASVTDETCKGANNGNINVIINGESGYYIYNWNEGQYNTSEISGLSPGIYNVKVTDINGCNTYESFNISEGFEFCNTPHAFVPNIFSPDGDGVNDILFVRGEGIKEGIFVIYDRWGNKIFETSDISVGWDGRYEGIDLNDGTFVYSLKVVFINDKIFEDKGTVTLIR